MPPVSTWVPVPAALGLMDTTSLWWCATLKLAVQEKAPGVAAAARAALRASSTPVLRMLPMLVTTWFERLDAGSMGTSKSRSLVFLRYQSSAPESRWLKSEKSAPTSHAAVDSQWIF